MKKDFFKYTALAFFTLVTNVNISAETDSTPDNDETEDILSKITVDDSEIPNSSQYNNFFYNENNSENDIETFKFWLGLGVYTTDPFITNTDSGSSNSITFLNGHSGFAFKAFDEYQFKYRTNVHYLEKNNPDTRIYSRSHQYKISKHINYFHNRSETIGIECIFNSTEHEQKFHIAPPITKTQSSFHDVGKISNFALVLSGKSDGLRGNITIAEKQVGITMGKKFKNNLNDYITYSARGSGTFESIQKKTSFIPKLKGQLSIMPADWLSLSIYAKLSYGNSFFDIPATDESLSGVNFLPGIKIKLGK